MCHLMPWFDGTQDRTMRDVAFDDRAVDAMTTAYEGALQDLGLTNRRDPRMETVAAKIIQLARTGERNPDRLRALAVKAMRA
jgi:hypothetical protein